MRKIAVLFIFMLCASSLLWSQTKIKDKGEIHGNVQLNALLYQPDTLIGAIVPEDNVGLNSYANLIYTNGKFSAGIRYEGYFPALNGFDARNDGLGIPHKFVSYTSDDLSVTIGSFYEQFGDGLILRIYEDKALDYDYSLEGVKLHFKPYKGVSLKAVYGKQRYYWNKVGLVRGLDAELSVNDLI